MTEITGKTIAEVIDRSKDYGGVDLIFTDGTAVRIDGDGYETSTVTLEDLTAEDREREAQEKIQRERDLERAKAARAILEAEETYHRETLSKEDFERWMDAQRPGWRFRDLMHEQYQAAYASMIAQQSRMLHNVEFWQGGRIASVPIDPKEES